MFLVFLLYIDWILLKPSDTASICDNSDKRNPLCCPGWMKNVYGDCVKSECDHDCGYGKCVGLNVCECYDKDVRSDVCPYPSQRMCLNDCSNKGQCINGKCICESGYSGESCNITIISTCYVKINRGLCKSTPENLQLSRIECCSMFQAAWGNPCSFCNRNTECPKGFILLNGQCEDIDECQFKSICLNGACINEKGSFRCQCRPDYKLDENTISCHYQRDQCLIYASNCGMFGRCAPSSNGQYSCICRKPFHTSPDGKSCVRNSLYNVCNLSKRLCHPYGECEPLGLSYICKCIPGFYQSNDRKSCTIHSNGDLCKNAEIYERCRGGQCISESYGYRCECYGEYQSNNNDQECVKGLFSTEPSSGNICSRWEFYSLCQGGECVDMNNDYYCKCTSGYYPTDNGKKCLRNGFISTEPGSKGPCSKLEYSSLCEGGECVEENNDYYCKCTDGFYVTDNGHKCQRIVDTTIESRSPRYCSRWEFYSLCQGGQCIDTYDGYYCKCTNGFYSINNGKRCEQIVYTTTEPPRKSSCSRWDIYSLCHGGQCIDTYDGYYCKCTNGYYSINNGKRCEQIVYTTTEPPRKSSCSRWDIYSLCRGGQCIDTYDGYYCKCTNGYYPANRGRKCERIDYTTTETPPSRICSRWDINSLCQGGECVDTYNGYYCKCTGGFYATYNGRECKRMDTKQTTAEPDNSYCKYTEYSSRCKGGQCIGDYTYGFKCLCLSGYTASSDGRSCELNQVNICETIGQKCQPGRCQRIGSNDYQCSCPQYTIKSNDGKSCLIDYKTTKKPREYCDIESNRQRCATGKCIPDPYFGFKCICKPGYKAADNGRACYKIEAILSLCSKYQLYCQGGGCMELDESNYECQCLKGFRRAHDGKSCIKNTDSENFEPICNQYGHKCLTGHCYPKGQNDYICLCIEGYRQTNDKKACVEIKAVSKPKCAQNQHRCKDGFCYDVIDGYICICLGSLVPSSDGRDCLYKNDIVLKTHSAVDVIYVKPVSKGQCKNKEIYEKCQPGICIEKVTNYGCVCPYSFKASSNEHECVRDSSKCPYCFYGCQNISDTSRCSCPEKYDNFYETGLCIVKSNLITHSLGPSTCNSESTNKTVFIRFNGLPKNSTTNSLAAQKTVSDLLMIKQQKSIRLSFCVPLIKRQSNSKRIQRKISSDLFFWQIVCIFNC